MGHRKGQNYRKIPVIPEVGADIFRDIEAAVIESIPENVRESEWRIEVMRKALKDDKVGLYWNRRKRQGYIDEQTGKRKYEYRKGGKAESIPEKGRLDLYWDNQRTGRARRYPRST